MNSSLIFKLLSRITMVLIGAFALSIAVGWFYKQDAGEMKAIQGLVVSMVISAAAGTFFHVKGKQNRGREAFFRKEALCVIGTGWLLAVFLGALPYVLGLPWCGFADAFFESSSGLTTTGCSIFPEPGKLPHSLIFWRALSQWIGGLGVVVFFVALLSSLGAGAKILYSNEASAHSSEIEYARVSSGAMRILMLYAGLSLMCFIALYDAGMSGFGAMCTTFATLSTGGFGVGEAFSPAVEWILVLFMTLGGTSFIFLLRLLRADWSSFLDQTEILAYYGLLFLFTLLTAVFIYPDIEGIEPVLRKAAFQVVSLMTSTGFSSADFTQWIPGAQTLLVIAMVIGGCTGSTSGGIKVVRFIVALRLSLITIEGSFRQHVIRLIRLNGRVIDSESQDSIVAYLLTALLLTILCCLCISVMEPQLDVLSSSSGILACIFNVGPGLKSLGPAYDWSFLGAHTKVFLAMIMVMGRLEFYALLVLVFPKLWRRFD